MTEQQAGPARPPYPREPNVHSGGVQEPGSDRDLPPYESRKKSGVGENQEGEPIEPSASPPEAAPRDVSQAEREGVTDTDPAPAGPHNVGQSTSTSGEDLAPRTEEAHRSDRLNTGISDEESSGAAMHPGDQGG